jgi:hypothetical protein
VAPEARAIAGRVSWATMGWRTCAEGLVLTTIGAAACSAGVSEVSGSFGGLGSATMTSAASDDTGDGDDTSAGVGETSGDGDGDGDSTDSAPVDSSGEASTGTTPPGECGNGIVEADETCDGRELGGSCADYGFDDGVLACDPECNHITDACFTCGDGDIGLGEACDGAEFGTASCTSLGFGSGALSCSADCQTIDDSGCVPLPSCGDGMLNGGELCDGVQLGGATCQSQGFDLGTIACTNSCTLDVTACMDDLENCGHQGDFCIFDKNDLQSTCCPAGVGDNVLGICDIFLCV